MESRMGLCYFPNCSTLIIAVWNLWKAYLIKFMGNLIFIPKKFQKELLLFLSEAEWKAENSIEIF